MEKEFNLSEKIEHWDAGESNGYNPKDTFLLEDVKEFIKRLIEKLETNIGNGAFINRIIHELAGEKLHDKRI